MAASLIEPGGDRPEQKDQKFTGLEFFKDVQLSDAKRALFRKSFSYEVRSVQCLQRRDVLGVVFQTESLRYKSFAAQELFSSMVLWIGNSLIW